MMTETMSSALRSILANRLRSILTILGIVIGVTSVILLISLVSGLNSFITSQIEGLGSNLIFVIPGRIGGSRSPGGIQANRLILQDATNLQKQLLDQAKVSAVVQRTSTLKYNNKLDRGVAIFGVQGNYPDIISVKLTSGKFFNDSEANSGRKVVVIGPTVASTLFGLTSPIGQSVDIGGLKYKVIGLTKSRGSTFGIDQDNSVLIPLTAAQKQFGLDRLNTIYISANNSEQVRKVQAEATSILKKRLSEDDFSVQTQEQTLSTISQITSVLSLALGGIAAISLIVGGIGIMNIMLVSVTERTKEIGLRKALGARPTDIRNQFLIEAITLSGLGGLIGITLGISLSLIIGLFLTTTITWWSIVLSFGFSTLVGILFGVMPAIRAARLNPIQALRYE
ncbi:hypothetical protein A3H85_02690 [Candidatus Daviesbacteria bacterium RIFCSPLOWO2_02_FULL_40_8]|uniref:Multidrug ABC transporter substrate-binding protein n=1 Tax=Candidatus Daviesbacteria bacterium RIFCSPLOWO2_01_FULL_40_24 TaxID=1797787 RepID=A0A1F5MIK2_9BACT|nr:MAG: hypothetical protein A2780_03415 [Candidatus Daviesbacteria bacterium RIFCSPHIGHO2_01_FULL_41_45]OGE34194.1 MAG: hypothetical protein A3C32_00500 [Candidatus Daviesbacteria bacterium RIFCSPHIGHO2_02_FULL_41_14]OGE65178.1 MAG: hypothetical protein A3B49_01450 [Candidatus Daviesbacteria bacterium RIFCSPLOWO2_01_FULL_40_24]OGE66881.1 MAG: hypothetical protein A3H85_02690 [Candidatus Daviesbacteria bacterium RIFCSPLOWO2_02_FULL_40_8]